MTDQWFVQRDGQKFGPYSPARLKQMTTTGQLLPVDLVSKGEGGRWVPASQIKGLFSDIPASYPAPTTSPLPPPATGSPFDFASPASSADESVGKSRRRHRTSRGRSPVNVGWVVIGLLIVALGGVAVFLLTRGNPATSTSGPSERTAQNRSTPSQAGSWAEKAFALSGEKKDPSFKPAAAGSLQDFFDAVNVLSVRIGDVPIRSGAKVPCHFAAPGCPSVMWHSIFGEPEVLSRGRERIGRVENEFDRWRVRCTDGSVTVHGKIQHLGDKTYYYPTMILVD